jgi:hypothetical protein
MVAAAAAAAAVVVVVKRIIYIPFASSCYMLYL